MRSRRGKLLDRLFALETFGIKLGLENISHLCSALDHPERAFTSVHVAGTNGKGSVTAMVHAALVAGGIRAARYTSPHLVDLTERFVIGSEVVDRDKLDDVANMVLDRAEQLRAAGTLRVHPTFFEATTAIAFELFRRACVEVAVLEVGLGGRFDSTNIVPAVAGAITSIGFDHQELLGDSLEAIAFEKAGIIKPGMVIVTGELPASARAIVSRVTTEQQARMVEADADTHVDVEVTDGRTRMTIVTPRHRYGPLTLALRGTHQVSNARVVVRLLESLTTAGIEVPVSAIEHGLSKVDWPGRLELIELEGGSTALLDAAHNIDGARALAAYLQRWHPERPALVLGMMRDKDVEGIAGVLLPVVSAVITTAADTPRAIPARELAARIAALGSAISLRIEPDPCAAVEQALSTSKTACIAGSVFLVGAVRGRLQRHAILR